MAASANHERVKRVEVQVTKDMLDIHHATLREIEGAEKTVAGYIDSLDKHVATSLRLNEQIAALKAAKSKCLNGFELAQIKYAQLLDIQPQDAEVAV